LEFHGTHQLLFYADDVNPKTKFSLCVTVHHAMKTYLGEEA